MASTASLERILESNPDLLPTALRYCRTARDEKGFATWSGDALVHVLRYYEPRLCIVPEGGRLTVAHATPLARAVIAADPSFEGFFKYRKA
jgi:hypothetical protein